MKVAELMQKCDLKLLNPGVSLEGEASFGFCCDLLSWVMTRACQGTAWITVMTHMNVVAVAALLDLSCVIIPESIEVDAAVLDKALEEGIPVLSSDKTGFEIAGELYGLGLTRPVKG